MSKVLRIAAPILLVRAAYSDQSYRFGFELTWNMWFALIAVAAAANLISLFWLCRDESPRALALRSLLLKIVLVPFSLPLLQYSYALVYLFISPHNFFEVLDLIYMQMGLAFLCLLISSSYGITAALRARNQGLSNPKATRLHIPMQLFPVADLVSSYKLYMHLRARDAARQPAAAIPSPEAYASQTYDRAPASSHDSELRPETWTL